MKKDLLENLQINSDLLLVEKETGNVVAQIQGIKVHSYELSFEENSVIIGENLNISIQKAAFKKDEKNSQIIFNNSSFPIVDFNKPKKITSINSLNDDCLFFIILNTKTFEPYKYCVEFNFETKEARMITLKNGTVLTNDDGTPKTKVEVIPEAIALLKNDTPEDIREKYFQLKTVAEYKETLNPEDLKIFDEKFNVFLNR